MQLENEAATAPAASPAPIILTKEQQAAKRAALLERLATLPESHQQTSKYRQVLMEME